MGTTFCLFSYIVSKPDLVECSASCSNRQETVNSGLYTHVVVIVGGLEKAH